MTGVKLSPSLKMSYVEGMFNSLNRDILQQKAKLQKNMVISAVEMAMTKLNTKMIITDIIIVMTITTIIIVVALVFIFEQ